MSCTPVEVTFPDEGWVVNATEIVLASLFGLVVGVLIALLCIRCFFKELAKDRVQKSSNVVMIEGSTTYKTSGMPSHTVRNLDYDKIPLINIEKSENSSQKTKSRKGNESDDEDCNNMMENFDADSHNQKMNGDGLIIALVNTTKEVTQRELIIQDLREANLLERELQQEKINAFIHLLKIFLFKFASKGRLEEDFSVEFASQYEQDFYDVFVSIEAEQMVAADQIISNGNSKKDSVALEEAIEEVRRAGARKLDMKFQEYQLKIKDDLEKNSELSEEEVNALMEKLSENMAEVEKALGRECARQASILQDRLAKRQALAIQYKSIDEKEEQGKQNRIEHQYSVLSKLCNDSQLSESQKESILKQYEADLSRVQENHEAEVKRQTMELASKLEKFRLKKMEKLKKKHQNEQQQLKENTRKAKAKDFVEAHHDLLEQQRNEHNDYIDELDYNEAEQISMLRKQLETNCLESVKEQENSFYETLADQARLTGDQVDKLMKKHWKNVNNFEEKNNEEKKRQLQILQEKIAEKKSRWMEEQERVEVEQQQLAEQQDRTVHKLLESQSGLDEEARNQILKQHAQNMAAINNQMQIARLKQQKILDGKLARREAYLENLKKKQEEENTVALSNGSETELEKLQKKHKEELNTELRAIEAERQQAMSLLRDRLASENKAVLKSQDAQLGLLIGKLQVGQTRRRGIIKKNDRAIKELEAQLLDTVVENDVSTHKTNSIIKKHLREVEDLNEKMQDAKEKQYRILKEKVESRMIKKEMAMEYKIDEEKKKQKAESVAAATAISIMNKMLLEQRHQQAKKQLENDMKAELVQQQIELNQQLEMTLVKELEEKEKDFLAQLAAISNMSKDDLTDVIHSAVSNGGGDEKTAHLMTKDFKRRLKSAKTVEDDDMNEEVVAKPKKKGKKKKKLIEDE